MKKIAWLAVLLGGVADMILTNVFTIPVAIYVVMNSGIARLPQDQVTAGYLTALHANPGLYAAAILCGGVASVCGGAVAALVAKHDRVLNGALSAWACVALDVFGLVTHTSNDGLVLEIVLMPASPLLGALGGYGMTYLRRARAVPAA